MVTISSRHPLILLFRFYFHVDSSSECSIGTSSCSFVSIGVLNVALREKGDLHVVSVNGDTP